jgi:hypothetical protein
MEIPGIGSTMNTFRTFLADMNIASKFLIRIGVTLGVASIVAVWFIARVQNEQSESDFRERMTNLAVTLRSPSIALPKRMLPNWDLNIIVHRSTASMNGPPSEN